MWPVSRTLTFDRQWLQLPAFEEPVMDQTHVEAQCGPIRSLYDFRALKQLRIDPAYVFGVGLGVESVQPHEDVLLKLLPQNIQSLFFVYCGGEWLNLYKSLKVVFTSLAKEQISEMSLPQARYLREIVLEFTNYSEQATRDEICGNGLRALARLSRTVGVTLRMRALAGAVEGKQRGWGMNNEISMPGCTNVSILEDVHHDMDLDGWLDTCILGCCHALD